MIGSKLFSKAKAALGHLVKPGGLSGEIFDLRKDILEEFSPCAALAVEEFTNLVGAAAPGAAVLKAATATVAAPVTLTGVDLLDAGEAMLLAWPRPLSFTTAGGTPADAPATATITGTDANGNAQQETVNLAQTATIANGTKAFRTVTSIAYPAADGTGATIAIGIGAAFLRPATATVTAPVTVLGKDLVQTDLAKVPRALVFTTAGGTPADAPATAKITGKDIQGRTMTETVNLAQTATTATSTRFWAEIDKIEFAAGDGTNATIAITPSVAVGLARKIKAVAGLSGLIREIANGALVTNGTIVAAATALPNGSYSPNSAPNDASDYAIYYDYDGAA